MRRNHRHPGTMPLAIALGASIALHTFILTPLMMAAMGPRQARHLAADLEAAPPEKDETLIGIEESEASTLDWIGYEEYQEHLAELSETNQAAFTEAPASSVAPVEPLEVMTPVEPQPEPELEPKPEPDPQIEPAAAPDPAPPIAVDPAIDFSILIAAARSWALAAFTSPPAPDEAAPAGQPAESAPAANPAQPATNPSDDSPGDPAEKESDPSSVIEISRDQWVLGKPLAAGGLELFPQKPSFTLLTRMTAAVGNPIALLEFDRRGVVIAARLLKSSGHAQVDKNIVDSLFGWRAKGKQLESLSENEMFPVTMQFLLVD